MLTQGVELGSLEGRGLFHRQGTVKRESVAAIIIFKLRN